MFVQANAGGNSMEKATAFSQNIQYILNVNISRTKSYGNYWFDIDFHANAVLYFAPRFFKMAKRNQCMMSMIKIACVATQAMIKNACVYW